MDVQGPRGKKRDKDREYNGEGTVPAGLPRLLIRWVMPIPMAPAIRTIRMGHRPMQQTFTNTWRR